MSNETEAALDDDLITMADLRNRYQQLCAKRDEVEARIAPLRAQLADAQVAAERARVYCQECADRLSEARGGKSWFTLKKNIGILAKALGGK
jgi:hypothetical protein